MKKRQTDVPLIDFTQLNRKEVTNATLTNREELIQTGGWMKWRRAKRQLATINKPGSMFFQIYAQTHRSSVDGAHILDITQNRKYDEQIPNNSKVFGINTGSIDSIDSGE